MPVRMLVPFDDLARLQETLCEAMALAERLNAELIVLRVNLPEREPQTLMDEASLYRELKALQAQCANWPRVVRIEAMAGAAEEAILGFAAAEGIDLIVATNMDVLLAQETASDGRRERVAATKARQMGIPYWQRTPGVEERRFVARIEPGARAQRTAR